MGHTAQDQALRFCAALSACSVAVAAVDSTESNTTILCRVVLWCYVPLADGFVD